MRAGIRDSWIERGMGTSSCKNNKVAPKWQQYKCGSQGRGRPAPVYDCRGTPLASPGFGFFLPLWQRGIEGDLLFWRENINFTGPEDIATYFVTLLR
jgi:hypothetical protein